MVVDRGQASVLISRIRFYLRKKFKITTCDLTVSYFLLSQFAYLYFVIYLYEAKVLYIPWAKVPYVP